MFRNTLKFDKKPELGFLGDSSELKEVNYQRSVRYLYFALLVFRKNEPIGRAGVLLKDDFSKFSANYQ
jgi:hypothetical protein